MKKLIVPFLILLLGAWFLFEGSWNRDSKGPKAPHVSTTPLVHPEASNATTLTHSPELAAITANVEDLPAFLEPAFLDASLAALKQNGSNLALPMPSKHLVRCESPEIATNVADWADKNGFETAPTVIFRGHGGVEFFDVELRRTAIPDVDRIQQEGRQILQIVSATPGTSYETWVGEIVGR
ncbi:MAG: ribonuclease E inhibitor RraB [Verrucomicrobiae bacterium]|nr:ribonuclease E inhibitor RraB [Verrucomicrobiae bacterium]